MGADPVIQPSHTEGSGRSVTQQITGQRHPGDASEPATTDTFPDVQVPLSDLWDAVSNSRYQRIHDTVDLFQDLQDALASGNAPFSTPVSHSTLASQEEQVPRSKSVKFQVAIDNPTYPWPSKAHFLTELLFSSPRLPFSEPQKRAILSWAKELGARDVPSLYSLNSCHEEIKKLIGDPTKKVVSASGNVFYINDIANAIAKDYANPLTRFAMQDFPEDGGKGMSQTFHGEKLLHELPSPPAVQVSSLHLYYRFTVKYELHQQAGFIVSDEKEIIPTSSFRRSFEDISRRPSELACGLTESSKALASLSPNVWREKSGGRMVYNVPLIIFMDDVSGNISKQWNKHHVIYMSNANLPREMLEQEFYVRFVTSSPHAAPMELMHAMKESILNAAESGVTAWDCRDNEEVILVPHVLFVAGDNPMQGEECSQAGLNCNYFCRTCEVGGNKEYKESDAGYSTLFTSGTHRMPERTINTIKEQFRMAMLSGATEKVRTSVSTTGTQDSISLRILHTLIDLGKRLRKREAGTPAVPESQVREALEKEFTDLLQGTALEDAINPLLGMKGVNIHLDTPTEILHTILLGVVKYFWAQTVFLLEKAKLLATFQSRLDSIDRDGLNAPSLNAEYICRYKGGLIGKHFKSLAQVMPFVIHDLVPQRVIDGWTTIGELVVLLWHTGIDDTEEYLVSYFTFPISHILTGGFWYEPRVQKWVHAGPVVLNFLSEHREHAKLLGIKVPDEDTPNTSGYITRVKAANGKTEVSKTVRWETTQCAQIDASLPMSHRYFYQGESFVSKHGEKLKLGGHVICVNASAPSGFCVGRIAFSFSILHPSLHLPCLELTDDKFVVSPDFFLNVYSIHNYAHILAALPLSLRRTPLRVLDDIQSVRQNAAQQVRRKKAQKNTGDSTEPVDTTTNVFDRAQPKPKARQARAKKLPARARQSLSAIEPSPTSTSATAVSGGPPAMPHVAHPTIAPSTRLYSSAPVHFRRAASWFISHRPRPSNSRRTASGSSASSRPTTPQFGGPLASSYQPDGPAVPTGITLTVPRSLRQRATSVGVLDEPISAGVRRERDDDDDSSQLDSHRVKRLKLYAKKIAEVNQISEKGLMEFVNTGDLFYMLVDIKAHLIKSDATKQTNQFQVLQDTLRGKDFEVRLFRYASRLLTLAGLHTRLLACMLSPNLTAYVTDTQQRIMVSRYALYHVFGTNVLARNLSPNIPRSSRFLEVFLTMRS
ncbi:hypothetical protein BKA83DRAFT_4055361 [Pisolithus microcarpus]|nr:hypothetical protein BKA83DRAFT_4055361 [Pisolithus microcarpus]